MENKYYIRKAEGGYSPCILGNKNYRDKTLNTLPNCVGWATGRFNEYGKYGYCKYLGNTNAENFVNYSKKQKLTLCQIPQEGACMVWEGKGNLAGHVAIVEKKISDTEVKTSESGWSAKKSHWYQNRKKGNGNWGQSSNYIFKGFLWNPAYIEPTPAPTPAPVVEELKVGDTVIIRGKGNGSSYGTANTAYGIGWTQKILKIYAGRKYPYQVGSDKSTTGFYQASALERKS